MMRSILTAWLLSASIGVAAQSLGTRPDSINPPVGGSPVGPGQLAQMLIAVTIVVAALKWLLPKALARIQRRIDPHPGSSLRVEETAAIGAGALWVVNVRGRTFLLGSTANGVSCLADLTETAPAEPVFLDAMDEALARPIPTATAVAAPNTDADRRQEALRRLERLAHDR